MNTQEKQVWRSGKAYPMAPDYQTPAEKLSSASVASDSPNQSNETREGMRNEIQVAIRALYHARNITNQPHFYAKLTMAIKASEACLTSD